MGKIRWLTRHFRQSLFFKIAALFLAALLLAAICLTVFSQMFFRRATGQLSQRIRSQAEMSLRLNVAEKLDGYAQLLYQLVTDAELRGYVTGLHEGTVLSEPYTVQNIQTLFNGYLFMNRDIAALSLFTADGVWAVQDSTRMFVSTTLWQEDAASGALDALIQKADEERHVCIQPDDRHPDGASFFHVVLGMWDYYSRDSMGTLVMTVDAAGLWRMLGNTAAEEYAFDFLMHADGRLLVYPDYAQVGGTVPGYKLDTAGPTLMPDPAAPPVEDDGWRIPEQAQLQVTKLPRYDVYLVSALDSAMYNDLARSFTALSAGMIVTVFLAAAVVFIALLRRQTEDINAVIEGIRQMRDGRLDVRIQTRTRDEIYDIAQTFNASLQSLEIITQQRDEEMQRFLQESERRRKAEVRSLLSQINSHFLYNTLNVINYTAMEGDTKTTSKMLKSLAECLHYTLNHNLNIVPVAEEVSWLEKYLLLQKERQSSLFDYRIEAGPQVQGLPVHKLVIQPFVENAILHGFSDGRRGHLLVARFRLLRRSRRLLLSIYDDGAGMEPEKLAEIKDLLNNYEKADGLGIGIENSCFRISTQYKGSARIQVRSTPGRGTIFNIYLPIDDEAMP